MKRIGCFAAMMFMLFWATGICRADSVATTPVSGEKETDWRAFWWPRWQAKLQEAKMLGDKAEIVFLGDSITNFWETNGKEVFDETFPRYGTLNLGFSGDRTQHTLWIARESGIFKIVHPKLIVLLIGTNNIGWRESSPQETVEGIKLILEALRAQAPQAKILLFAVFPCGAKPDDAMRKLVEEINRGLPKLADGENIFYVDISDKLTNADGTIDPAVMPDYLHPAKAGYATWRDAILPYVVKYVEGE